ncbi:MAG: Abortive infection protein [Verrucomicrobia bacterium]|nr:Abortive infection protein [Verrucomicrobiota bacterium]
MLTEIALIFGGLVLLWRYGLRKEARETPPRLTTWPASGTDFFVFVWLVIAGGFLAPMAASHWIKQAALGREYELILSTAIFQFGMLAGVMAFALTLGRRSRPAKPAPFPTNPILAGGAVFLISVPVVSVVSLLWLGLLKLCHIDAPQQEAIDLLRNARSSLPFAILLFSAIVIAPINEELLFRAGIFRFVRSHLPRWAALLLPAVIFGLMHMNVASFAPLVALGIIFSLAYERTGRISTTMVAHALFNLMATLLVMAGVDL